MSSIVTSVSLTEILRSLIRARKTGCLRVRHGEESGLLALENGMIMSAQAGVHSDLHALFQLAGWRHARFDFEEGPVTATRSRSLAGYDPQVLVASAEAQSARQAA